MTQIYILNHNQSGSADDIQPISEMLVVLFGAWSAPSHYLNQYWNIVDSAPINGLRWGLEPNLYIFIQESAFENVVCEVAAVCLGQNVLKEKNNRRDRWLSLLWTLDYDMTLIVIDVAFYFPSGYILFYLIINNTLCCEPYF